MNNEGFFFLFIVRITVLKKHWTDICIRVYIHMPTYCFLVEKLEINPFINKHSRDYKKIVYKRGLTMGKIVGEYFAEYKIWFNVLSDKICSDLLDVLNGHSVIQLIWHRSSFGIFLTRHFRWDFDHRYAITPLGSYLWCISDKFSIISVLPLLWGLIYDTFRINFRSSEWCHSIGCQCTLLFHLLMSFLLLKIYLPLHLVIYNVIAKLWNIYSLYKFDYYSWLLVKYSRR